MSDVSKLFAQYAGVGQTKQAQVAQASDAKKAELSGYRSGAEADVGLTPDLTADDLIAIGNQDPMTTLSQSVGRQQYIEDASTTRSYAQGAGDSTVDVVNGFLQGAMGIGAMGAGVVSDTAGTAISGAAQKVNDYLSSVQSDPLNDRRRAYAERNAVTSQHTEELRQAEIAKGSSPLTANLRKVGRDFLDAFSNADGPTFQSGTSQGIGSLLVGGVIGKGIKAAGGLAAARAAVGRAGPSTAAHLINRVTNAGAMPAAIGALEGGGAYTQTVNEVMGMDHEQLLQTSPDYAALLEQGWSPADAKAEVANHAGLMAGAIQAPIGVATGALVSKFEANPFSAPSIRTALQNTVKETVEEGIQSGSGQLNTNLAIKAFADKNRELTDGVGQSAGEGALYGMGTAGALQIPGAVGNTAKAIALAPVKAGAALWDKIIARNEQVKAEAKAAGPMSDQNIEARVAEVQAAATPEAQAEIEQGITESAASPAQAEDQLQYTRKLFDAVKAAPVATDHENPTIASALEGSQDRFDALRRVSQVAGDEKADKQDRIAAGLYILNSLQENEQLFDRDLNKAITEIPDDHPALPYLRAMEQVLVDINEHEGIKQAVSAALKQKVTIDDVQNIDSAEGQKAAQNVAQLAEHAPELVDAEVADKVLQAATPTKLKFENINEANDTNDAIASQMLDALESANGKGKYRAQRLAINSKAGLRGINYGQIEEAYNQLTQTGLFHAKSKVQITPAQRAALEVASALVKAMKDQKAEAERLNLRDVPDLVTDQIRTDEKDANGDYKSAVGHLRGVQQAYRAGNIDVAKERLRQFANFAQHMQNKVGAINEHLNLGTGNEADAVKYQSLIAGTGKFIPSKDGLWVNPEAAKTVRFAQRLALDTKAVTALVNTMAIAYPELGIKPLAPVELDARLDGTPEEVKQRWQAEKNKNSGLVAKRAKAEASSPAAPAEAVQPVAEADTKTEKQTSPQPDQVKQPEQAKPAEGARTDGLRASKSETPVESDASQSSPEVVRSEPEPAKDANVPAESKPTAEKSDETVKSPEPTTSEQPVESRLDELERLAKERVLTFAERDERLALREGKSQVEKAFPGLHENLDKGVRNQFVRAYSVPKTLRSRLTGLGSAALAVYNALATPEAYKEFAGKLSHKLTADLTKTYRKFLRVQGKGTLDTLNERLKTALETPLSSGKTPAQLLAEGNLGKTQAGKPNTPINTFEDFKALNLVVQNVDGTFEYQGELAEGAMLAGLQWLLLHSDPKRKLSDEEIAEFLGLPDGEFVPEGADAFFNTGVSVTDAAMNLGAMITRYWGVTANPSAPLGYSVGIAEAMAKEVLMSLVAQGLIKQDEQTIDGKKHQRFIRVKTPENDKLFKDLSGFPSAIEELVVVDPEGINHVGTPPTKVATKQTNGLVDLTEQQIEANKARQEVPHYVNRPMANLLLSLGSDIVLALFGHGDIKNKKLNANYRKSLEGQNTSISAAYAQMEKLLNEVENMAEAQGKSSEEVPVYYEFETSTVGRQHMQGAHNPQSSKLMREVMLPTWATVNLLNVGGKELKAFHLAIAQHLGIKVEQKRRNDSVSEVIDMLTGKHKDTNLTESVKILQEHLKTGRDLTSADIAVFQKEFGSKLSFGAFSAVLEYARYLNADKAELKAFKTPLYLEADGKTDGPINALMHLASGMFDGRWLELMAKGGLYVGSGYKTLADFVQSGTAGSANDLYKETTISLEALLKQFRAANAHKSQVTQQMNALWYLMNELLGNDFRLESGNIVLERGVAKNPLTVTIYGSGTKGIANKVVGELVKEMYRRMSEDTDVTLSDKAVKAIRMLTEQVALNSRENGLFVKAPDTVEKAKVTQEEDGSETVTFSRDQLKNLQTNVKNLFVSQLNQAIDDVVGKTVNEGKDNLRKAVQTQSIFLQHLFKEAIEKKIAEKQANDPAWKRNEFLSKLEIEEVFNELKKTHPFITTGTQIFFPGGSVKTDIKPTGSDTDPRFSRTLDGKLPTPAWVAGPTNAGVKGIPFMIIGPGDGQMMQNVATMEGAPEGTLLVFDGMNMKLSTIEEDSRKVNQAVYDAWLQGNPLQAVEQTFSKFLEKADLTNIGSDMAEALLDALYTPGSKERKAAKVTDIAPKMKQLQANLQRGAKVNAARKRVLSKVNLRVDHMASAESPHEVTGKIELAGSFDEVATKLNEMLLEELGLTPSKDGSGAKVLSISDVFAQLGKQKTVIAQKQIVAELQKALKDSAFKVITGSVEELRAYALQNGQTLPEEFENPDIEIDGYISPANDTIYLVNPSAETMIHELLHAATYGKVATFYSNPSALAQVERDAMGRIEQLFNQWMALKDDELNRATQAEFDAWDAVEAQLAKGNKAAAVNEFMAWTLSNKDLIKQAKATKATKLAQIAARVLAAINDLIWGKTSAPKVGSDLFSNLRFNTSILLNSKTIEQRLEDTVLFQSRQFGNNDRLTSIRDGFFRKLERIELGAITPEQRATATSKIDEAMATADEVVMSFRTNGFPMTMQEKTTFKMMVAAFATEAFLDPNALIRVEDIYAHVTKNLKVEDFMKPGVDRYWAGKRYDLLMGNYVKKTDPFGRSSLMSAFLALAATNDDFRDVLANMTVPKSVKNEGKSIDDVLENFGTDILDKLTTYFSGEGRNAPNSLAALDALVARLAESVQDEEGFISQQVSRAGGYTDKANELLVDSIKYLTARGIDKLDQFEGWANNKYASAFSNAAKLILSMANEDRADVVSKGVLETINRTNLFKPLHDIIVEMIGRTSDNALIYDMIKLVRSTVQQLRQQFREHLPETIEGKFSRKLTDEEWSHLLKGLAKTDLAALHDTMTTAQIIAMLKNPTQISNKIADFEESIQSMDPDNWLLLQKKMKELAQYMNTGKTPSGNFLKNADAIANLLNERVAPTQNGRGRPTPSPALVEAIDHLTTLYAVDSLEQTVKDSVVSLAQTEEDGMAFAFSYLVGQRNDERVKAGSTTRATFNHYKGHIPTEGRHGVSLIVANDTEFAKLKLRGYERVADYGGSIAEPAARRKGYYFAPLSGRAPFNQGVLQNVRETAYGVDPLTGYSVGPMTAGRITDPALVQAIRRSRRANDAASEPLMPIFDADGHVVAYERSIDPQQEFLLQKTDHLAQAIGIWRGRQAEEATAAKVNEALVNGLAQMWENEQGTQRDSYINVFDPREQAKDPVLRDAIALMTPQVRNMVESRAAFDKDEFWVRKDLLNNALGYRSFTVGDLWSGNTRIKPEVAKTAQAVATGVFGANAYKWLVSGEKYWQNFVQDARMTIVVKSVVVPAANLISNMIHLVARGVPIKDIVAGMPKKTAEVNAFVKGRLRKIELEAELRAAETDLIKSRQLKTEIESIEDGFRRMSIWPLIEAGEFASISDAGITREEILLSEGRLNAYMEKLTDKLPEGVRNLGRYAIISRDTALFKGLQRAVEYGDFLGKAILFDDLTKRQKKDKAYALGRITEEFINYDFLAGRSRNYLEDIGLMWFWNFKVRAVKIAASTLRNNPLHFLMSSFIPMPDMLGSVGSPVTDNAISVAFDNRMGYSLGPGQAFHAHTLNPYWNFWN